MIIYKKNIQTNEYQEFMQNSVVADVANWVDVSYEEYQNIKLPSLKQQKIIECKAFYDNLRYFNVIKQVENGNDAILTLKATQDLTDAIQSWVNELNGGDMPYYNYLGVNFTLEQCKGLLFYISKIRNFCAKLSAYYCGGIGVDGYINANITTYQELELLNYTLNPFDNFTKINKFNDFILM
jgi:hypothetical protein